MFRQTGPVRAAPHHPAAARHRRRLGCHCRAAGAAAGDGRNRPRHGLGVGPSMVANRLDRTL